MCVCLAFSVIFIYTVSHFKNDLRPYEVCKYSISFYCPQLASLCFTPAMCLGNSLSSGEQMHTVSDSRKQPGPPSCAVHIVPLKMSLSLVLCIHLNSSLLSGEGVASL